MLHVHRNTHLMFVVNGCQLPRDVHNYTDNKATDVFSSHCFDLADGWINCEWLLIRSNWEFKQKSNWCFLLLDSCILVYVLLHMASKVNVLCIWGAVCAWHCLFLGSSKYCILKREMKCQAVIFQHNSRWKVNCVYW